MEKEKTEKTEMRKRGRPRFEDDHFKAFMMPPIRSQYSSMGERTLQNKYYESIVICCLIEMEREGEETRPFWDISRKKQFAPSLVYEIGRMENEDIIKATIRKLQKEMKEHPGITIEKWRKDLRDYRKTLKAEGII